MAGHSGVEWDRPLKAAACGDVTAVRVTHQDRLARSGTAWRSAPLARDGVTVEVPHPKGSSRGAEEPLAGFMSLVATYAGSTYGHPPLARPRVDCWPRPVRTSSDARS